MNRGALLSLDVISARGLTQRSSSLQIHILYRNQLLRSPAIEWIDEDPVFNLNFPLSVGLHGEEDPTILLYVSTAEHGNGSSSFLERKGKLLATAMVDYRVADAYPADFISVELLPCVDGDGIGDGVVHSGGLIFLRVSRSQQSVNIANNPPEEAIAIITKRQEDLLRCQREFIHTSRQWWSNCQRKYPFLQERNIKLIAKDECGHFRFVGSFINPMKSPRSLINPRFAARYVSLLPLKRDLNMTGIPDEAWHCPHAFLSRMEGNVEDHALLLCNLLLGWGLDAWVATGTIYSAPKQGKGGGKSTSVNIRPHSWVVTIDKVDVTNSKVTLWETLTGSQYEIDYSGAHSVKDPDNIPAHHFHEIHTLFKHDSYLFNVQPNSQVPNPRRGGSHHEHSVTSFDLTNPKFWLPMPLVSKSDLKLLRHPGSVLSLPEIDHLKDWGALEFELENELKLRILDWRKENSLETAYDSNLEQIVHSALLAYEWDRAVGVTFGNADFQAAVRRYVKRGEYFKGYPTCFSHRDPMKIMQTLRASSACKDVCLLKDLNCRLGIRVKIVPYPSDTMSVWIMIAACAEKEDA